MGMDPKSKIVKSNATDADKVAAMKTAQSDATGLKDDHSESQEQHNLSAFLQVWFFIFSENDFHLTEGGTYPQLLTQPDFFTPFKLCILQMFTGVYGVFVDFLCNIYEKGL